MPQSGPEIYRDASGQYRWRVYARNNVDIVGDSGESYNNEADAIRGLLALVDAVDTVTLRARLSIGGVGPGTETA